jgi:hypothetical protein
LVSELNKKGIEVKASSIIHENEQLAGLQKSRDLFKKQLHKISVEKMLSDKTRRDKTIVARYY